METEVEVTGLNRESKTVTALDHKTGETKEYSYDKLVIATGASPIIPPVEGIHRKNVFVMRTPDDAVALRDAIEAGEIKCRRRGRSRLYWPGSSRKSSRKGNSDYRHRHGPSDPAAGRP